MAIRNWIIALLGILGVALVMWAVYETGRHLGEVEAESSIHSSRYARQAAAEIERSCIGEQNSDIGECAAEIISRSNEEQRAQDDLIAQTEMATWAFWMLIATVAMAVLTGIGVVFVWQTLEATRRMAADTNTMTEDTRKIGEAQTRAYLTVDSVKIVGIQPGKIPEIILVIKNTGNSPAMRVNIQSTHLAAPNAPFRMASKGPKSSGSIGAGSEGRQRSPFNQPFSTKDVADLQSGKWRIGFAGVISYSSVFSKTKRHRVTFRYASQQSSIVNGEVMLFVSDKHNNSN